MSHFLFLDHFITDFRKFVSKILSGDSFQHFSCLEDLNGLEGILYCIFESALKGLIVENSGGVQNLGTFDFKAIFFKLSKCF